MHKYILSTLFVSCAFLPAVAQETQQPVSLSEAARSMLQAFERFRLEQLRTDLIEAQYQQALKQESISNQPFKTQSEAAEAMQHRPENEPEEEWNRYVETSVAEWNEFNRLNARVAELIRQIESLEKTLNISSENRLN